MPGQALLRAIVDDRHPSCKHHEGQRVLDAEGVAVTVVADPGELIVVVSKVSQEVQIGVDLEIHRILGS